MSLPDELKWKRAVEGELESLNENRVFEIVERPTSEITGRKPNILDLRWVSKLESDNSKEARIFICGFKVTKDPAQIIL